MVLLVIWFSDIIQGSYVQGEENLVLLNRLSGALISFFILWQVRYMLLVQKYKY